MSGQTFSTFTEVGMIDARLKTGAITLPTTTSIPFRILTLKDVYGATSFSTVTISTQTGDTFEDGTTTRSINAAWGMTTLYAGKAGTWYTIGGSILTTASISSLTVSSIFGLTNFVSTPYLATQLGSTVIGLGTAGYISSIPSIGGFVSTANLAGLVSTANLATLVSTSYLATQVGSTVIGLGSAGYVSTIVWGSVVSTANLANLVSTANLTNLVSTANLANLVSTANLATLVSTSYLATQVGSTVVGLGTAGYVSTIVWGSVVSTANLVNLVSTANLANLVSTANLANVVSTANLATLVSTTYLASQLNSTVRGLGTAGYLSSINYSTVVLSSLTAQNLTSVQGYISSLTVDSLFLGSNSAFVDMGDVIATSLSTMQINVGTQYAITISSQQLYVSSIQATNIIGALTTSNLTSTVIGLGTVGYISTGLGGFGFVSTANLTGLVSTTYLATQLASTVIGLGTAGYISSIPSIGGFVSTANLAGLVSTANLAGLVSTTYLATQLGSTVIGLGTAGYISSAQLLSTSVGLSQYISSFIDPTELTSTVIGLGTTGFVSSLGLTYAVASTAQGLGTFGYTSTSQLLSTSLGLYQQIQTSATNIVQQDVTSTIIGLGTFGYISTIVWGSVVSTANLANHISTANLVGLVSTANLANLVSTNYLATQLNSTVRGLGTTGYLSSINYSSVTLSSLTAQNLTSVQGYISSLVVDSLQLGSNTAYIYMGDVIATSLSTVYVAAGSATIVSLSAQQLYVSSIQATNIIGALTTTNLTSTVIGLGTAGYISTPLGGFGFVSTANLANHVSTANLASLVSTANLASLVSTANLATLVSTSYLATQLGSTVIGLGTAGYLSTVFWGSVISTANLATLVSSANLANLVSSANLANLVSSANLANLVSTANLANLVSTTYLATQLGSTVIGLGTVGYISSAQLLSTTYGYSLNFTTQVESVSSLRFSTATANNAYISSLTIDQLTFGDGNGWADFGVLRALAISTVVVNTGILYATTVSTSQIIGVNYLAQSNLTSTVIGLGTVGYLSSVTAANLGNLVSTANLANLVSTANLANLVSTTYLAIQLGSTVIGLGTAGYLSTVQWGSVVSTANLANLVSTANLAGHISTANLAGHISTANLANFVSTTYLSTQLGSTFATLTVSSLSTINIQGATAFISSLTVNGLFIGSNQGFVNMGDVIGTSLSTLVVYAGGMYSTSNSTQQAFLSSINGVSFANIGSGGIAGIPSSLNTSSISTFSFTGTTGFISSLTVNGLFIGSNQGFVNMGDVIGTSLSTLQIYAGGVFTTSNQATIVSTQQLNISSINGQTFGGPIASTVIGLGTAGYLSTIVFGSIVSTANLANLVSTANLVNLVSTSYLATQLGSTVIGLGTAGYISSAQFLSSFNGISLDFKTSSLKANNVSAATTYVSSMVINTLQIGLTPGFIQMGDIITTSVSTILTTTNLLNAGINAISSFNVYGGTNQAGLGFKFFGSSIQSPLGQSASISVSSVSTYTTMYLGTFDQYAPGRGPSLGFGANNINGVQTLQGRITGTPTTYTPAGGDQGTLNFDVNASGQMYNVMTMWAIGSQPTGRVGINCNAPSFQLDVVGSINSSAALLTTNSTAANGVMRFTTSGGNSYIQWGSNNVNTSYGPLYFTNPNVGATFMALSPIGYGVGGTTSNFAQTYFCSPGAGNSNNFVHYYTSGASGCNSGGLYANHYQLFTYPAGSAVSVWDINSNGNIIFTNNIGISYGVNTTPSFPLDVNGTIRGNNYMTQTGVTYCPNSAITQLYTINYPNLIYVVEWTMRNSNGYASIVGGGFVNNNSYVTTLYAYTGTPYVAFINGSTGGVAFGNNTGGSFNVSWSVMIRILI